MCTAVSYRPKDHYFGRNLDLEYSYNETITITPRCFPLHFRHANTLEHHLAMIGMAYVADGYPLYYEATNEAGLSMAGLNFPGNAVYCSNAESHVSVAPFELIPWILAQYSNAAEAVEAIKQLSLVHEHFRDDLPVTPLHWLLSDKDASFVIESMTDGILIHENPVGVLTNNPPFEYHMLRLNDFLNVTNRPPENRFADELTLVPYSLGMGSIGLPGDMSSSSRFVRAAFVKANSIPSDDDAENLSQFFHILDAVFQPKGCTMLQSGLYEYTLYSSCCNTTRGVYYYKTYENNQISGVNMHTENLDASSLIIYPMLSAQQIHMQNQ